MISIDQHAGLPTVADRLARARHRRFVGRVGELSLVREALTDPERAVALLHFHGPGGVGKTALLDAIEAVAGACDHEVIRLDAREVRPTPAEVEEGLRARAGAAAGQSLVDALAGRRVVLVLDACERLRAIDDWMRRVALPSLPADTFVVAASRLPPSTSWRLDPGWRDLLRVVALRNLPPEDSAAYLRAEGVPEDLHAGAIASTHGHPLALALVATVVEQGGDPSDLLQAPEPVRVLLERFLSEVPTPAHRLAVQVTAHARLTTEALLREALQLPDASELFSWLRSLSFIETGSEGVFPHDLARDVVDADLRWRDPPAYVDVHARVRQPILERVRSTVGRARERATFDLVYLHRNNVSVSGYWAWDSLGEIVTTPMRLEDRCPILDMVARHEGEESARLAAMWMDAQPEGFTSFVDVDGRLRGFLSVVALTSAAPEQIEADPGTAAVWAFVQRSRPVEPGQKVTALRFVMDGEHHSRPSPGMNLASVTSVQRWLSTPHLAWDFLCLSDPAAWEVMFSYIDYPRIDEATFTVDGEEVGVFGHDWRQVDIGRWLDLMERRELDSSVPAPSAPATSQWVIGLSRQEFASAVRAALRDLQDTVALDRNPLARSCIVEDRISAEATACCAAGTTPGWASPRGAALGDLLLEAADRLATSPKDAKLHRALDRTYLRPAGTQERAAEVLGLPFSTYRRHLARAVERIVEDLWLLDVQGQGEQVMSTRWAGA